MALALQGLLMLWRAQKIFDFLEGSCWRCGGRVVLGDERLDCLLEILK